MSVETGLYSAGTAFLSVVPAFVGVEDAMRDELRKMGVKLDAQMAAAGQAGLRNAGKSAAGAGKKAAEDYSGAFNKDVQKSLRSAVSNIPVVDSGPSSPWSKAFEQVRKDVEELSKEKIGITIDENTAFRSIANIRDRVRGLETTAPSASEFHNARSVGRNLDQVMGTVEDARLRGQKVAAAYAGALDTKLRETLSKALGAIRPVTVTANTSQAEREIGAVRTDIEALSGKTIGVDISSAEALAKLRELEERLRRLDSDDVDIRIRMEAREATSGLEELRKKADGSADAISKIETVTTLGIGRLGYLIALGSSIGSAIVPGALASAGALGFVGTSAAAAAAGVGVLVLGMAGIPNAVQALNKYTQDQNKSQSSLDESNRAVASSTDAVTQAIRALGNTRRTVAEGEADAERSVREAVAGVADARHAAAIAARESARAVVDGQRDVTRAEADAREVRTALNDAIKQARENMEDLSTELERNSQDERKAVTEQMAALNQLNALKANPRSTEVELRRARDAYNEQTVRILELKDKRQELAEQEADQAKRGVEGDTKVIAARKRVAEVDERLADARVRRDRAREDAAERTSQAQERIADAEARVAAAQRSRDRQRIDGAFQLASAQAAVQSAARSQAAAVEKAGVAGGEALDTLNDAMAELSPTQQTFSRFIFGLKDELGGLRAAAADPMLPGFQQAIEMLLPVLPGVANFIGKIAGELGSMAIQAAKAFQGPVWGKFFDYIDATAVPAMQTWFEVAENVTEGLISTYLALTPFDGQVGRGLVGLSEDFARWAAALGKSEGYREFLEYVRENGPKVLEFLGDLGHLAIRLIEGFLPLGHIMLNALDLLVDGLNAVPMPILQTLVFLVGGLALVITGVGAALRVAKLKQQLGEVFGDSARSAVQKYAIETGRATTETGKFRTATATAAGAAATMRDRLGELPGKVSGAFDSRRTGLVNKFAIETGFATQQSSKLEKTMGTVAGAAQLSASKIKSMSSSMGGLKGVASGLVGALGGPWTIAIAAATAGIAYFTSEAAAQQQRVDTLKTFLGQLGDKYTELSRSGKQAGQEADEAFKEIVQNNPEMRDAVLALDGLGVSFDQMMNSLTSGDPSTVVNALNGEMQRLDDEMRRPGNFFSVFDNQKREKRIDELDAMKTAFLENAKAMGLTAQATQILTAANQRNADITAIRTAHEKEGKAAVDEAITAYDTYGRKIEHLNGFLTAFATGQTDVAAKVSALRTLIDDQTKGWRDADDAADAYQVKLLDLNETLKTNGGSLDRHTRAGLNNRAALKQAAAAVQELYLQDIASGTPMDQATKRHETRIERLKKEASEGLSNKKVVEQLVDKYGDIPKNVKTMLESQNFDQVYAELQLMQFMQQMLAQGKSVEDAKREWKDKKRIDQIAAQVAKGDWSGVGGLAKGGPVVGPGTGTSDDVLIRASNDEHMLTAAEVQAAGGHDAIYAWRRAILAGVELPAYAQGGAITKRARKPETVTWPFKVDVAGAKIPTIEQIIARSFTAGAAAGGGAGLAGTSLVHGSPAMERLMEGMFSGATVTSSYRPGDPGYHGKPPEGQAIDLVFSDGSERRGGGQAQQAFNYIAAHHGKTTAELIWDFSPWGPSVGIWNGGRHRFMSATSGPGSHNDHLHWATYDQGGWLPPGARQTISNLTGKPEAVLNPAQWSAVERQSSLMERLVASANTLGGGGGGPTYNMHFRDSTLDAARLRSMQQRDDAMQRTNRGR